MSLFLSAFIRAHPGLEDTADRDRSVASHFCVTHVPALTILGPGKHEQVTRLTPAFGQKTGVVDQLVAVMVRPEPGRAGIASNAVK